MSWLPSVKALAHNVGFDMPMNVPKAEHRDSRIQIALTTAIPLGVRLIR
jgi:hypothetical protein